MENSRAKKPKPKSSSKQKKRKKSASWGGSRRKKRFNRDDFFNEDDDDDDDYDDDDDNDIDDGDDLDNERRRKDNDSDYLPRMDSHHNYDDSDHQEPDSDAAFAMIARHREIFMERAFGDANIDSATNVVCRPQEEVNKIIYVLENWEVGTRIHMITNMERRQAVKAFRDTHKFGYKWVKSYSLHYIGLPDGTRRPLLRRIEPNRAVGRIVVSREDVFNAIDEGHRYRGHRGQERTHTYCSEKYYNCTQALVRIYCETCFVCMQKNPAVAPLKGSRKPIRSNDFRDRFQVDLIDFRKMRKRDPFGVLMRWIVTVKDHATGFTHVSAIPQKRASYVAHRLQELFRLIGYPSIFHTDNGEEFTAHTVLKFLRQGNPNILTVTGRPRKPSDQGSVECMNRLVKRIISSELSERRMMGENPNWTEILGLVTAMINSQRGRSRNAAPSYTAIFGKDYDQNISCSMEEARQCWTVGQRLQVCITMLCSLQHLRRIAVILILHCPCIHANHCHCTIR